jgi:hypothetical protein
MEKYAIYHMVIGHMSKLNIVAPIKQRRTEQKFRK